MKVEGKKDWYREKVVDESISAMRNDEWNITRLRNDCGKAINLEILVLEILKSYYQGKTIVVEMEG